MLLKVMECIGMSACILPETWATIMKTNYMTREVKGLKMM